MKSVLSKECCKKEEKPFPKLMISEKTGSVLLMSDHAKGTCVFAGENAHKFMAGLADTSAGLDMTVLTDYEGDVCLTNDD